jgi:hypothetical protein
VLKDCNNVNHKKVLEGWREFGLLCLSLLSALLDVSAFRTVIFLSVVACNIIEFSFQYCLHLSFSILTCITTLSSNFPVDHLSFKFFIFQGIVVECQY